MWRPRGQYIKRTYTASAFSLQFSPHAPQSPRSSLRLCEKQGLYDRPDGPRRRFLASWPNLGAVSLAVAGAYARGSEDFFIINDPQIASRPASRRMATPCLACRGFGRPALLLSLAAAPVASRPLSASLNPRVLAASVSTSNANTSTSEGSRWPADVQDNVQGRLIPGLQHPTAEAQRELTSRGWKTEHAKPTTCARLPKRVRPSSRRSSVTKKGGARKEWPARLKKSIPDAGFN